MHSSYVTVIDYRGEVLVETFVRPTSDSSLASPISLCTDLLYHRRPVTDYRFTETGLNPACLATAPAFANVKQEVARHLFNKIVVGYNIWDFLSVSSYNIQLHRLLTRSLGDGFEAPSEPHSRRCPILAVPEEHRVKAAHPSASVDTAVDEPEDRDIIRESGQCYTSSHPVMQLLTLRSG